MKDSTDLFRHYKKLGERAMAQCPDEGLFVMLDAESNSIAIIVKHMAGNMRSRWKDFLTTDGEKPDRNRDTEFDLTRTVTIRSEPHSVMQAINRQVAHYAHHVGQIVLLAKHFATKAGKKWETLSVPRGQSKQFTAEVAAGKKSEP